MATDVSMTEAAAGPAVDLPQLKAELHEACEALRVVIDSIVDAKTNGNNDALPELVTQGSVHLLTIRRLNREANYSSAAEKEVTATERQALDAFNLSLQSFEFEKNHLLNEIQRCRDFRSAEEDLDLVPVEVFVASAPPEMTAVSQEDNAHQFKLNRLTFESQERQRLLRELEELDAVKAQVSEENARATEALESLHADLTTLLKAAQPIEAKLTRNIMDVKSLSVLAQKLPGPLYITFSTLVAFREAFNVDTLNVDIVGSSSSSGSGSGGSGGDGGGGGARDEDADMRDADEDTNLYTPAPLSLTITLAPGEGDKFTQPLVLTVEYLPQLGIVTVCVASVEERLLQLVDSTQSATALLTNLFPNDTGVDSPNPANVYSAPGGFKYDSDLAARPFGWAQSMGGLEFITSAAGSSNAASSVAAVVRALRRRLNGLAALVGQIESLSSLTIDVGDSPDVAEQFPLKAKATLTAWRESSVEEFDAGAPPRPASFPAQPAWVRHAAKYFAATLSRDDHEIQALVEVTMEYPIRPPLFRVQFSKRPASRSGPVYDNNLKVIENELNSHYRELISGGDRTLLLPLQMRKLQMCVDVFVETDAADEQSLRHTLSIRRFKGRNREMPFSPNDAGLFEQR